MKIVVFDLDETLGYFTQYGIFLDCLKIYLKEQTQKQDKSDQKQQSSGKQINKEEFDSILDLYPEFLRPNIINILTYLKTKKDSKCCHKMMIYTNNNGPREWAHQIIDYFQSKINYKLVDQIIAAFKVNGKQVEICRTTHSKTHEDFIRCTKLPSTAEICFLDDYFYPDMINDNIYYINIKPYYHDVPFEEMLERFKNSKIGSELVPDSEWSNFFSEMLRQLKIYKYAYVEKTEKEYEIDKILGKQITTHLEDFFNQSKKNKSERRRTKKRGLGGIKKHRTYKRHY